MARLAATPAKRIPADAPGARRGSTPRGLSPSHGRPSGRPSVVNRIRAGLRRLGVLIVLVAFVLAGASMIRVVAAGAGWRVSFPMSNGTITICDRQYRGGDIVRTEEEIVQRSGFE